MADRWQLAAAVTLRAEAFGGMAFHRQRGVTLELDGEAYRFVCACREPCPLPPPGGPAARLVPQLVRLGFLCPAGVDTARGGPALEGEGRPRGRGLGAWDGEIHDGAALWAPETVHLAIVARCNRACPGCYVPRMEDGREWTVAELRGLIDQWAQMRVFQLAVGGGEPLLYEGLCEVLAYASERGVVPSLTTNGSLLDDGAVRRLEQAGVARVNVSWNGPAEDGGGPAPGVERALQRLRASTLQVGVNLLVVPALLSRLPQALARLRALGVQRATLLRPKPPAQPAADGAAWYVANRLCRADLLRLRQVSSAWQGALAIEVDSALAGLMGDAGPARLRWRGVYGCAAGRRICTVWPDGRVTPCSFLADLDAGNVHQVPFADLWRRGAGWERLRDPTAQLQGGCADCAAASQCGGARCIARYEGGDLFAGDAACPHRA